MMMDAEEVKALKDYVRNGGAIYASRYTSLFDKYKGRKNDFMLSEVFGVSFEGITDENVTYITPEQNNLQTKHLVLFERQIKVKPAGGKVLAHLTLPYTNPSDPSLFASIHSNPPGILTDYLAIVINRYGRGKACYVSGAIEKQDLEIHRKVFLGLLKMLTGGKYFFESDAPKPVEILVFKQREHKRYIINLVNFQQEMPNIPVRNFRVRLRLPEKPAGLFLLPSKNSVRFIFSKGTLEFSVPELKTFLMYELEYKI